jgi:hypothetical protein
MRTLHARQLALILSAAAIALAGCGGSSKKSPTTPPAGTGTAGSTNSTSILSPSTAVNSTAYKTTLASRLAQIPGLPSGDVPKIVSCAVQKLESQGIKTVGDVHTHSTQANQDGLACAHGLGLK